VDTDIIKLFLFLMSFPFLWVDFCVEASNCLYLPILVLNLSLSALIHSHLHLSTFGLSVMCVVCPGPSYTHIHFKRSFLYSVFNQSLNVFKPSLSTYSQSSNKQILLHLSDTGEKWEFKETVHQLFINLKNAYDSVRREVL
jgi:hypothetical protein